MDLKGQMIFDNDSLVGFNSVLEMQKAISLGFEGQDQINLSLEAETESILISNMVIKQMYTGGANQVQAGCTKC